MRAGAQADVAIGDEWTMKVDLPPVSFGVGRPVREEMVEDINEALDYDVNYEIPDNYLRGEGDSEYYCDSDELYRRQTTISPSHTRTSSPWKPMWRTKTHRHTGPPHTDTVHTHAHRHKSPSHTRATWPFM